jgi:alkylation response protein AidB-like acyl-CoA dehydrogenase
MDQAPAIQDLELFRAETRAWLAENAPEGIRNLPAGEESVCWGGRKWVFASDDQRLWLERMAARGWTVPEWPKVYGGGGLSRDEARILRQELSRINAKDPLNSLGIWMLGPALLKYGTEEQKLEFLPPIARGEIRWAQGYSEPGAGSDLASIQTKALDDGDDFIVNGSKIWTSYGDKCDWIFALVRSEPQAPKHLGISFLLIDMTDPGVTTRPIKLIAGDSPFTQTFFDNVRVPKKNIVGERGRGWDVTKYLLQHEREMIGSSPQSSLGDETISQLAVRLLGREALAQETALRNEIIQMEMDSWIMGIALEYNRDQAKAGKANAAASSFLKLVGTELNKRRCEIALSLGGVDGLDSHSAAAHDWLHAPANCIAGGSSEIQLNIISKRVLGLPGA